MRFTLEQVIGGPVGAVARIYTEPRFYEAIGDIGTLGRPEVLDRREDGTVVRLTVRYRFSGHLSPAVTSVIDPARLTWVEESVHDLEHHTVTFTVNPDHYADRLRCSGSSRFVAVAGGGTQRFAEGDVAVRAPLVGRAVEGAIVSGLREHLEAEVGVVERLLAGL